MTDKLLLTVKQAADLMGISLSQAYEVLHKPDFPVLRLGPRCTRIPLDALREWLNRQATQRSGMAG